MSSYCNAKKAAIIWLTALISFATVYVFVLLDFKCNKPGHNAFFSVASDTLITVSFDTAIQQIDSTNYSQQPTHDTIYLPKEIIQNLQVDTWGIVAQYLSCVTSTYSYRKDSQYSLVITDSVCLAKLLNRQIEFKNLRPDSIVTITNNITETKVMDKARLYLGLQSSLVQPINPGLFLAHKKVGASVHYTPLSKQFSAGFYYKLW